MYKECSSIKKIYEISLTEITKSIVNFDIERLNDILDNIIIIRLKQREDYEEEEEGKIKIIQGYGMDTIYNKIHDLFKDQEIEAVSNIKKYINVILKYKLLYL